MDIESFGSDTKYNVAQREARVQGGGDLEKNTSIGLQRK